MAYGSAELPLCVHFGTKQSKTFALTSLEKECGFHGKPHINWTNHAISCSELIPGLETSAYVDRRRTRILKFIFRFIFNDGVPNKGVTQGISRNEVKVAISRMKNGKATGMDGIPVEVWKCLGEEGIDMLWDLMKGIYEQEKIPTEWRDSVIIPIYKEKGDIQDCGNYRGIKLMSHTMKIWERIIDRRLREETTIGDEQFGFMPGRGTTDAIFAVRQL